ncbi:MAG: aminoacyl-tRNA hydrolase [Gammaproteobacteria bacterium]|nr:aminoacyl-tRNA hydrolase [Gammaproteobacteria bacterium]
MAGETDPVRLIVGLGNPGTKYEQTRHNAGFWFVNALVRAHGDRFASERKFDGEVAAISLDGREVRVFKPGAFMNRSGGPVRAILNFYKLPLSSMLIAHDEIDLPPGVVRLKRGGGHGGHNGLRDVFAHLGQDCWRLRLGVGHPGRSDLVVDYVLSKPGKSDQQAIIDASDQALATMPMLAAGQFEQAMQRLHTPRAEGPKA